MIKKTGGPLFHDITGILYFASGTLYKNVVVLFRNSRWWVSVAVNYVVRSSRTAFTIFGELVFFTHATLISIITLLVFVFLGLLTRGAQRLNQKHDSEK